MAQQKRLRNQNKCADLLRKYIQLTFEIVTDSVHQVIGTLADKSTSEYFPLFKVYCAPKLKKAILRASVKLIRTKSVGEDVLVLLF